MPEPISTASVPQELRGHGTITRGDLQIRVYFTFSRDRYNHTEGWAFRAVASDPSRSAHDLFNGDLNAPFTLDGELGEGLSKVHIPGLSVSGASGGVLHGTVYAFSKTSGPIPFAPLSQFVVIHLSETAMAMKEYEVDGQYEHGPLVAERERSPVEWTDEYGKWEFSTWFTFEKVAMHGATATLRVPHPTIRIAVSADYQTRDFGQLFDDIDARIALFLRLVGFLGRQRVQPTHIVIRSTGSEREYHEAERFYSTGNLRVPDNIESLVYPRYFRDAIADGILARFESAPLKKEMLRSIDFLLSGREERTSFGEQSFLTAFTAFEMLINAYSEYRNFDKTVTYSPERYSKKKAKKLRSAFFSRIADSVRRIAQAEGLAEGLDECATDSILEKIPELERAAFVRRVLRSIKEIGIATEELWPENSDLDAAIRIVCSERNSLVHSGKEPDYDQLFPNTFRLNMMTERLLYSLMGGKQEWISPFEKRNIQWLRSGEHVSIEYR